MKNVKTITETEAMKTAAVYAKANGTGDSLTKSGVSAAAKSLGLNVAAALRQIDLVRQAVGKISGIM